MKVIHIDTYGMTDDERTAEMLRAVIDNLNLPKRKELAKDIRERNRRDERRRKVEKKWKR